MTIKLASALVEDQDKALKFYTEVLGFVKKKDIPPGKARCSPLSRPKAPVIIELLLEPTDNPAAKTFQTAPRDQGIPLTAFALEHVKKEPEWLKRLGVVFPQLTDTDGADDRCGLRGYLRKSGPDLSGLTAPDQIYILSQTHCEYAAFETRALGSNTQFLAVSTPVTDSRSRGRFSPSLVTR